MIEAEITALREHIKTQAEVFSEVYWYDRRSDEFKGIDDTKGIYAYLRYLNDDADTFELEPWELVAKSAKIIGVDLVLVAHFDRCKDAELVAQKLTMIVDDYNGATVYSAGVDTELIYNDETNNELKDSSLHLVRIKFRFIVRKSLSCETSLCTEC